MNKGLICNIYKDGSDCTLMGVSSKAKDALLVMEDAPVFEEDECRPTMKIVRRTIGGNEYIHVQPIGKGRAGTDSYMFGGNFLYSCDSRFGLVSKYPVPIHDRQETNEEYDMYSR